MPVSIVDFVYGAGIKKDETKEEFINRVASPNELESSNVGGIKETPEEIYNKIIMSARIAAAQAYDDDKIKQAMEATSPTQTRVSEDKRNTSTEQEAPKNNNLLKYAVLAGLGILVIK